MATAHFNEENSADIVTGQNVDAKDERLREVMDVVIRHLHAAVKEIEPTQEEWMQAIKFLTATGHKCDDWRQEYILLSDVLGVSMLVDAINSRRPEGASENTVLGPFHIGGTPEYEMGTNICLDGKGEDMVVRGRVLDIDGNPLEGVKIDVWQANDEGFYDLHKRTFSQDNYYNWEETENGKYFLRVTRVDPFGELKGVSNAVEVNVTTQYPLPKIVKAIQKKKRIVTRCFLVTFGNMNTLQKELN